MAASMGAFLLSAGTKGKRKSLPNSRIMIHQPLGGSQGEATDLEISAKLILHTKDVLNTYLSAFCDQPMDKLRLDTDRDFYMTPEEALSYGIIDEVIQHKNMIKTPKIPSLKVIMIVIVLCMQCMMLTVCVCVCVCLSVSTATGGFSAVHLRRGQHRSQACQRGTGGSQQEHVVVS